MSPGAQHAARAVVLSALARQRNDYSDDEFEEALARVYDTLWTLHEAASKWTACFSVPRCLKHPPTLGNSADSGRVPCFCRIARLGASI